MIGVVCASSLGFFLCKKINLDTDNFILILAYLVAFGILGAKVLYVLVSIKQINFSEIFKNPESFNSFIGSGFVFYGGLIGGFLALIFVHKIHKIDLNSYIKILAVCLPLAHAFGRIGCSFAGCCYGRQTNLPVFFKYTESLVAPIGVKLFPVQGIESFCLFLLSFILLILFFKKYSCKLHLIYICSYSTLRFILEFFRGDSARGKLFFLSTSQIISLLLLLTIIIARPFYNKIRIKNSFTKNSN